MLDEGPGVTERPLYVIRTCLHHNGTGQTCKRGVEPHMVTDHVGRVACHEVRGICGAVACDLRQFPEVEPIRRFGPASKMLAAVLDGLCASCGQVVTGEMEFNGAILALPCRHVIRSARDAK